jgi:hypothetical protein
MSNDIKQRMVELLMPIEKQIMMCDDDDEMLMLACAMLQRTTEIFEKLLGEEGRKRMFSDLG